MKSIVYINFMFLVGCASMTESKIQPISISAFDENIEIQEATCCLTNDKGVWYVKTPGSVVVQKSSGDMIVTCEKEGYQTETRTLISKSNSGMYGNILAGGLIGYAIDSSSGAGFDYPNNIRFKMKKNAIQVDSSVQPTETKKPSTTN